MAADSEVRLYHAPCMTTIAILRPLIRPYTRNIAHPYTSVSKVT